LIEVVEQADGQVFEGDGLVGEAAGWAEECGQAREKQRKIGESWHTD